MNNKISTFRKEMFDIIAFVGRKFGFYLSLDLFSHSRAMHLYQRGMPLELISQWLGHRQLTTTLVYAHADVEQKRQAIEKAMMNTATINVSESIRRATKKLENDSFKKLYGLK